MITLNVCIGSACHLKGSYNVVKRLQELIESNNLEKKITIRGAFCLGKCTRAVSVRINEDSVYSVDVNRVEEFFRDVVIRRMENGDH